MKLLSLFFALLFISSCAHKDKIPPGILPQSKMQAVLWDMICAGEFINGYILSKDSIDKFAEKSKIYSQVLQVHHMTKEEFDKSYGYYRQHPALLKVILDSLSKKQVIPTTTNFATPSIDTLTKKIGKPAAEQ